LLYEIRENSLESYQYQDIPFEKLVDGLDIERATNKNPLFQVRFVVIEDGETKIELYNLEAIFIPAPIEQCKFDLLFRFFITKKKIIARVEYLNDLYDIETIKKFSEYFISIIESIIQNLDIKVRDISILNADEKDYQLIELNNMGIFL